MMVPYELNIWMCLLLLATDIEGQCSGGCKARQLGTPQYITRVLQCDGPSCQSAVFVPSAYTICLITSTISTDSKASQVRIYLGSCKEFNNEKGYFVSDTASVVTSKEGTGSPNTVFTAESCRTICGDIEVVRYNTPDGLTLAADETQAVTRSGVKCNQGLYVYPSSDAVGACSQVTISEPGGTAYLQLKRRCPWQTRKRALLTITDGESVLAIGAPEWISGESYRLPIVDEFNGEVLYAQEYNSKAVGAYGTIERVTAYTLQLVKSKKYLVADVLDDTTLNYDGYHSTGLTVKDASEFPGGYASEADYRFFIQYNVTIHNQNATVFCPLFHRNYCLSPGVSGYLRLTPLRSTDRSLEPTFVNPTDEELRHFILYSQPTESQRLWHVKLSVL